MKPKPADGERIRRIGLRSGQAATYISEKTGEPFAHNTLRFYLRRARAERAAGRDRRGLFPEPDYVDPLTGWNFWLPATLDRWLIERPGKGHRSDLDAGSV